MVLTRDDEACDHSRFEILRFAVEGIGEDPNVAQIGDLE
jgi:hypothetical protein